MNKTPHFLLALFVAGVLFLAFAPAAQANCNLPSEVVFHGFGGRFVDCAEGPGLDGRITLIEDPVGTQSVFKADQPPPFTPMDSSSLLTLRLIPVCIITLQLSHSFFQLARLEHFYQCACQGRHGRSYPGIQFPLMDLA